MFSVLLINCKSPEMFDNYGLAVFFISSTREWIHRYQLQLLGVLHYFGNHFSNTWPSIADINQKKMLKKNLSFPRHINSLIIHSTMRDTLLIFHWALWITRFPVSDSSSWATRCLAPMSKTSLSYNHCYYFQWQ